MWKFSQDMGWGHYIYLRTFWYIEKRDIGSTTLVDWFFFLMALVFHSSLMCLLQYDFTLKDIYTITAVGPGSVPGQGTKIPQAVRHSQKKYTKGSREKRPLVLCTHQATLGCCEHHIFMWPLQARTCPEEKADEQCGKGSRNHVLCKSVL